MLAALTIGLVPPLLGVGVVALHGRQRVLGLARSLALGAALAVVLAELLPGAADAIGPIALWVAVGAMFAPVAIERLSNQVAARLGRGEGGLRARYTFGFLGVAVHQLADGLQIGAGGPLLGLGVVLAIAVHGAPLVAAAVLAVARVEGQRRAVWRGLGLVAATGVGVVLGAVVPTAWLAPVEPWLRALIAGLLVHVVAHDLDVDLPTNTLDRMLDLVGFAAGVALPLTILHGGHAHQAHAEHGHLAFGNALWELTVEVAPVALAGLVVAAIVQGLAGHGVVRGVASAARLGALRPADAGCAHDTAGKLRAAGAAPGALAAFVVAVPLLDPTSLLLAARLLGWPFALLRALTGLAAALLAGWAVGGTATALATLPPAAASLTARVMQAGDRLARHLGSWVALGLVVAAYIEAFVHPNDAAGLGPLDALAAGMVAVLATAQGAAVLPVATMLVAKGMSAGAALAATLLGPAVGLTALAHHRSLLGRRAVLRMVSVQVAVVCVGAVVADLWLSDAPLRVDDAAGHAHSWPAAGAAVVLALVVMRGLWRSGARGFIAHLVVDHDHDHDHDHLVSAA